MMFLALRGSATNIYIVDYNGKYVNVFFTQPSIYLVTSGGHTDSANKGYNECEKVS